MTFEEYKARLREQPEWAPGWDAVDDSLRALYGEQEPEHFAPILKARFGGTDYIDGYSIYVSRGGYRHIVTYGMSALYADPALYGKEFSNWGYEMTMKLNADSAADCSWALHMLGNLARYTYTQQRWFEPGQFVLGNGEPVKVDSDSKITSLVIVKDPELPGKQTVHGKLDFLQLVGVTWNEIGKIREDLSLLEKLVSRMKQDNPNLVCDLARTEEYL